MNELLSADLAILLIEPSATQRKIIAKELQEEGISNIDFADSLESAKTMLTTSIPDLVISSMYFSDGTAQELQAYINTELSEHGVPFMLVSSETRKTELEIF
ncbi:two-component system response regulator, partial [Pseudoalteromonas ruthenica]